MLLEHRTRDSMSSGVANSTSPFLLTRVFVDRGSPSLGQISTSHKSKSLVMLDSVQCGECLVWVHFIACQDERVDHQRSTLKHQHLLQATTSMSCEFLEKHACLIEVRNRFAIQVCKRLGMRAVTPQTLLAGEREYVAFLVHFTRCSIYIGI